MNTNQLMNEILAVLQTIQNDKHKLEKLHQFVVNEIYEEPEPEEIPEKYKKIVSEIADNLLAGLVCFLNPDTLEIEFLPKNLAYDPEEFEMVTGETWESAGIKHENWQKCIEVEPMESFDSFKVMEYFIDELNNEKMQEKLVKALNKPKPFANFRNVVENSDYRQQWFEFRQKQWEYYVWNTIKTDIGL